MKLRKINFRQMVFEEMTWGYWDWGLDDHGDVVKVGHKFIPTERGLSWANDRGYRGRTGTESIHSFEWHKAIKDIVAPTFPFRFPDMQLTFIPQLVSQDLIPVQPMTPPIIDYPSRFYIENNFNIKKIWEDFQKLGRRTRK